MDSKSFNCSVFFRPNKGGKVDKMPFDSRKPGKKMDSKGGECLAEEKLFTITYIPETPVALQKSVAIAEKNATSRRAGTDQPGPSVEIEECISPNIESEKHLKINGLNDGEDSCRSCFELKNALDYSFQKVLDESKKREAEKEKRENERPKSRAKDTRKKYRHRKHCKKAVANTESSSRNIRLNAVEDTRPVLNFMSRLIRSESISRTKEFTSIVENTLSKREKATTSKNSFKGSVKPGETEKNKQKQAPEDFGDVCQFCDRLRQVMYNAVSTMYEEDGEITDFPTVQKLERNVFLVYSDGATCRTAVETKRKRFTSRDRKRDSSSDIPKKPPKMNKKRKSEDDEDEDDNENDNEDEDEDRKSLRLRIKRHRAAFNASKGIHIAMAMLVSLSAIYLIFGDLMDMEHPHGCRIGVIMVILFFGCMHNLHGMLFRKTFSFRKYCIIPVCWIILSVTNGKCADYFTPYLVCNYKLQFMSQIYLFIVFLEYYLASGIHAILVLEINHYRRIPIKDLLRYSIFNLPLMVLVILYTVIRCFAEMKRRIKRCFRKSYRYRNT